VEDESDQQFITEVFSGCVRYAKPILVVLEGFYNRDGKNTLRSQQSVYHVLPDARLVLAGVVRKGQTVATMRLSRRDGRLA
ncbi:hypothetical protein BaRGS_00035743, partial [Batillaria attramentaria]